VKKRKNNNLITRKDLEQTSQTIVKAVDFVLKKQLGGIKTDVSGLKEDVKTLKTDVSGLKEDVKTLKTDVSELKEDIEIIRIDMKGLKKEMSTMEERLGKKIDSVQTLIDGYVKAQEEFKQEFVIMKEEVKQIKLILKQKLGVEIKAI
jgi:chromosome segregation ATPase